MSEYIEKEGIKKSISFLLDIRLNVAPETKQLVLETIDSERAADVQPIKRGHWYHNTSKYVSELDAYFIQARCSCRCRYNDRIDQYSQVMSNIRCSYCGADMRDVDAGEMAKE